MYQPCYNGTKIIISNSGTRFGIVEGVGWMDGKSKASLSRKLGITFLTNRTFKRVFVSAGSSC